MDNVGNVSTAASDTITIDTTDPVIDTIAVTSSSGTYFYDPGLAATGGTTYFNSLASEGAGQTLTVTVTWTETNKKQFQGATAFSDSPSADTASSGGWTQQYSVEASAATQSNIVFTVTDEADRTDTATVTFTQDNTDPNAPSSVQCRPDAADGSGEYDNDTTIYVTWTNGTDAGSGLKEHRMDTSNPPTTVHTSGETETGEEGEETFYVVAVDNVGNVSTAASDTITIDLTAPVIDTIAVTSSSGTYFYDPGLAATGGTVYFNSLASEGSGQTLTVTATVTEGNPDSFQGATAFGDSPSADTSSAGGWTQQYSVEENATTQSGIVFTVTDDAGNTDTATITFTQDNTDPNAPSSVQCRPDAADGSGEYDDDTTIYVTWTNGTDAGAGIKEHRMDTDNPPTTAHTSGETETGEEGEETFYVVAVDNVGNVSSAASDTITIDLTDPVIDTVTVSSSSGTYFYDPGLAATGGTVYFNSLASEGSGQTLTVTVTWTETNKKQFQGATAFSDSPSADTSSSGGWTQQYTVEASAAPQSNIVFTATDQADRTDTATVTFT